MDDAASEQISNAVLAVVSKGGVGYKNSRSTVSDQCPR